MVRSHAADRGETAVYGFFAGGFTVMSLAGAEVSIKKLLSFCESNPQEEIGDMGLEKERKNSDLMKSGDEDFDRAAFQVEHNAAVFKFLQQQFR